MPIGPQPHLWKTGPDPERHLRYRAWLQQRNQARWRGEVWNLSFEAWLAIWGDQWQHRGRERHHLCLTRRDYTLPWDETNAEVVTRQAHNQRQADNGRVRKPRRTRAEIEQDRELGIIRLPKQAYPL